MQPYDDYRWVFVGRIRLFPVPLTHKTGGGTSLRKPGGYEPPDLDAS
jgi:hypothetical protein